MNRGKPAPYLGQNTRKGETPPWYVGQTPQDRTRLRKLRRARRRIRAHTAEATNRTKAANRTASMIYLRPTNDQPVNIVAARVIGPVWGNLELL